MTHCANVHNVHLQSLSHKTYNGFDQNSWILHNCQFAMASSSSDDHDSQSEETAKTSWLLFSKSYSFYALWATYCACTHLLTRTHIWTRRVSEEAKSKRAICSLVPELNIMVWLLLSLLYIMITNSYYKLIPFSSGDCEILPQNGMIVYFCDHCKRFVERCCMR